MHRTFVVGAVCALLSFNMECSIEGKKGKSEKQEEQIGNAQHIAIVNRRNAGFAFVLVNKNINQNPGKPFKSNESLLPYTPQELNI